MRARRWTILCWTVLAGLGLAALWEQALSLMIGVAVAAVWGLATGFA